MIHSENSIQFAFNPRKQLCYLRSIYIFRTEQNKKEKAMKGMDYGFNKYSLCLLL